jgi:hypothetical protein
MQQEYRIIIKNERYNRVRLLQVIFLAVIAIVFCVAAYYENDIFSFIWTILICFTIFFSLNQQDFVRYRLFRSKSLLESGFIWAIIGSMLLLTWWITLLIMIIAVMQGLVKKQYEVILDQQAIQINAKPPKNIEWQALQNIVIKDELLTIDYKNNKIFQAEIIPALSTIGSEADFNDFCRLQLAAH